MWKYKDKKGGGRRERERGSVGRGLHQKLTFPAGRMERKLGLRRTDDEDDAALYSRQSTLSGPISSSSTTTTLISFIVAFIRFLFLQL